jgi:hypothetical protein
MLISDKLVFIELQKTGSTHIKTLLRDLVGGKNDGKHNTPPEELLASGKTFIGSIRDPWAWYLSLWTYGCQQKGELFQRLTNEKRWERVHAKGKAAAEALEAEENNDDDDDSDDVGDAEGGKAKGKTRKPLPENWGAERAKNFWYADPQSAEAFREWLQVVLATRTLRRLLEAGYGKSPISKAGGLLTFRYFTLFVRGAETVDNTVSSVDALKAYDKEHCFVSHFIRNEALAADFLETMAACGVNLTDAQKKSVLEAKKTNVSTRPKGPDFYYDDASIQLVMRREKFIIDKFDYKHKKP